LRATVRLASAQQRRAFFQPPRMNKQEEKPHMVLLWSWIAGMAIGVVAIPASFAYGGSFTEAALESAGFDYKTRRENEEMGMDINWSPFSWVLGLGTWFVSFVVLQKAVLPRLGHSATPAHLRTPVRTLPQFIKSAGPRAFGTAIAFLACGGLGGAMRVLWARPPQVQEKVAD
jgi:hypothetical protein